MASGRDRDDPLSFTSNPSSASSPVTVSDYLDNFGEPTSRSGSFQSESLLGGGGGDSSNDADYGFARPDFRSEQLAGTVQFYERHVFLCYKKPSVWPARIEAAEFDRLPRLLSAAVSARKGSMKKETRLTICEGHDGTETSNGDVLIFPDMIRYRRLTHFDVDTFVEEVLVKDGEWLPGNPEMLKGSYVFVCSHGSRDRRCGVCGPPLVSRFREELEFYGLQGKVSVSPCSHIGGHKYAGNVIIYQSKIHRKVTGHWYGYVQPDDVHVLLEKHIIKGEIVDRLWRGEMGLSEEDQKKTQERRLQVNGAGHTVKNNGKVTQESSSAHSADVSCCQSGAAESNGCCQQNGNSSSTCCQDATLMLSLETSEDNQQRKNKQTQKKNMAAQASGLFSSAVTTAATSGVKKLHLFTTSHRPRSLSFPKTAIRAEKADSAAAAPAAAVKEEAPVGFTPPQLDPNTPSPIFAGSTGGLLRKAQVEEFYVITWNSPKEQIFEMPTGGAAIMREGPNLLKLARKEQCLALGTRLRSKYKINYQFYRVFPNGEVQYLHPKDGVYPEKANAGREGVGQNMRSIGKNVSPIEVKFTGKQSYDL